MAHPVSQPAPPTQTARSKHPWRRRLAWIALSLVLSWLLLSWLAGYLMTRRWSDPFSEPAPVIVGIQAKDVRLQTSDGEDLGGWYVAGPDSGPSVLLLHGWRGCRGASRTRAELFTTLGCSSLAISLRAHGDSTGVVNDFGRNNRHDVLAAVAWLEQHRPGRPILINGVSQGAAAAIFVGGELGERVQGYLLEAPYRDLATAVRSRTRRYLPPVIEQTAYLGLMLTSPFVLDNVGSISPTECIGRIPAHIPVWILTGSSDPHASPADAEELLRQRAGCGRLVLFPEVGHRSLRKQDPQRYEQAALEWLTEALPVRSTR